MGAGAGLFGLIPLGLAGPPPFVVEPAWILGLLPVYGAILVLPWLYPCISPVRPW